MATVGNLNGKIAISVEGIADIQRMESAYHKLRAAQDSLAGGATRVNATALASVEREREMTQQITGVSKAGSYDPSRLAAFSSATKSATIETKKLWSAQVQAKVAANALAVSLGGTSANGVLGATKNLGNTTADSQKGFRNFGLVMQQAGYQAQDFAVQVAGGQNKLVAFSQQASQMAGFFGPTGAMVGAGLAVGVLIARMVDLDSGMKEEKSTVESLAESYRELAIARNPDLSGKFAELDSNRAQKEYDDQTKKIAKLKAELADFQSPESRASQRANAAMPGYSAGVANTEASLVAQIAKEYATLDVLQEKVNKTSGAIAGESRKHFESVADTVAAESKASADADSRYMNARKENALMEMSNNDKLAYYLREMEFLEEIGAKKTEEYELAKRRARELDKILMDESAKTDAKRKEASERAQKVMQGLSSRIPQSLQSNASASATGGFIGRGGGGDMISIQKGILEGIRALVAMERMAGGSN